RGRTVAFRPRGRSEQSCISRGRDGTRYASLLRRILGIRAPDTVTDSLRPRPAGAILRHLAEATTSRRARDGEPRGLVASPGPAGPKARPLATEREEHA